MWLKFSKFCSYYFSFFGFLPILCGAQSYSNQPTGATFVEQIPVFYDYFDPISNSLSGTVLQISQSKISSALGILQLQQKLAANTIGVTTIQESGDSKNRVDLVFVGDGYTQAQLGLYANQVTTSYNRLFSISPFREYKNYFNVYRIDLISSVSGISGDPTSAIVKNTPLGMTFWCNGIERLLCANFQATHEAASIAPEADQIFALANSSKYGGSAIAFGNISTAAAGNNSGPDTLIHEIGHSLGDLGDEYSTGGPTQHSTVESFFSNISVYSSSQMSSRQTKWFRWLGYNPGTTFDGLVSTYQGADYSLYGVYRPSNNSVMRNLGRPFNMPSVESLIVNIYKKVKLIDKSTPNSDPLRASSSISISTLDSPSINISWTVDGQQAVPKSRVLFSTFTASDFAIGEGEHDVTVQVVDDTPWVRDPNSRKRYLTDTRTWRVVVGDSPPAPVNVQATDSLKNEIKISFSRPFDPSGFVCNSAEFPEWCAQRPQAWGITSYKIYRSATMDAACQYEIAEIPSNSDTVYSDSNVTPGVNYYYSVKSVNSHGTSRCSTIDAGMALKSLQPGFTLSPPINGGAGPQ